MAIDHGSWSALCEEFERATMGQLWVDLVFDVCSNIAPKYPPGTYNSGITWDDSSIRDLAQEVILDRLIGAGQLAYIIASVSTTSAARGLVGRHVKQVLVQRVIPNQRDNVAERLFSLFENLGESVSTVDGVAFRPNGSHMQPGEPVEDGFKAAVALIRRLPRLPNRGVDRLSPLFTTDVLESSVAPLWEVLDVPVTKRLLLRILGDALTGMTPVLFQLDEATDLPLEQGISSEDEAVVNDLVERLVGELTPEMREILVNVDIMTDSELATVLGVSRPTALKRRHELRDYLTGFFAADGMEGLSDLLRGAVLIRSQHVLGRCHV